jgi:DsbC/DsbD-like thiol-disulfide interchange protein
VKNRILFLFIGVAALMSLSTVLDSFTVVHAQTTPPKITTQLSLTTSKVRRGRTVRGSLVLDIPTGYHVNAHSPISRFALPTKIEVEGPAGMKIGSVVYPKAIVRRFSFSKDRLGVYEGRAVIRFTITIPLNQTIGQGEVKARLSYQSCSDEVCFPPVTREIAVALTVT